MTRFRRSSVAHISTLVWRVGAVLCLFAQMASLGHMVLVRHEVCPEDGEVVHHRLGGALGGGHETIEFGPSAGASLVASRAEHGSEDHDHCAVVAEQRSRAGVTRASACEDLVLPVAALSFFEFAYAARTRSIDLLFLAPKNSPPV